MSNATRALVGIAAVVAAVVLFVLLQGSDDSDDGGSGTTTVVTTTDEAAGTDEGSGGGREKPERPQKPPKPKIPTIKIKGGQPVGGVAELEFRKGDKIEFYVESDVADHVHLHVYDVMKDVAPGERVKFSVPATIEGIFEAELEDRVVPIAEIRVNP